MKKEKVRRKKTGNETGKRKEERKGKKRREDEDDLGVVEGGAGGVELSLEEGEGLGEVRDGLLLQRELLHLRDHLRPHPAL